MSKRRYTGILARPIAQNDEAARQKALETLCAHYGVAPETAPSPLAGALMAAHVPAFRPPNKQQRHKSGRTLSLSTMERSDACRKVKDLMRRRGMRITSACRVVWSKGYSGRCSFERFRHIVTAVANIPEGRLFHDEPGDNEIVKSYKSDLRRMNTIIMKSNSEDTQFIVKGKRLSWDEASIVAPDFVAKVKRTKELLLELESEIFLG